MKTKEAILLWIVKQYLTSKFTFEFSFDDFDPKRKDPYFIVGNHVSLIDGLYTFLPLHVYAYPVINSFQYTSKIMKFFLTKVIRTIPKRKGQNDISTIRSMMDALRNGNGVMLFPEGNASYFGEQGSIPYSTAKFLKKAKTDIILCKVNGGYLANPRWADYSIKKGLYEVKFSTLIKAEKLPDLSVNEIYNMLVNAITFNDFEWNKIRKYKYRSKKRAEGLERFIYLCPRCNQHQTLTMKGNQITCSTCGEIASFNEFSILEGLHFDNLISWGNLQLSKIHDIVTHELLTEGVVYSVNLGKYQRSKMGKYQLKLADNQIIFQNKKHTFTLNISEIKGIVLTNKNGLSFDYLNRVYYVIVKDPMLFLNAINYIHGGEE